MKILIKKRFSDIHVCLEDTEGVWASGKTLDDALGNLVRCHIEYFGIEGIEWDLSDHSTRQYLAKIETKNVALINNDLAQGKITEKQAASRIADARKYLEEKE